MSTTADGQAQISNGALRLPGRTGAAAADRLRRFPTAERRDPRALRVALLAPPWITVPPRGYGGIEVVLALLARALTARGHGVTLLAPPGSEVAGVELVSPLRSEHPEEIGASVLEADHVARAFALVDERARRGLPFDVVHDHSGWIALAMADRLGAPLLHTIHGAFDGHAPQFYLAHGRKAALTCISAAQAAAAPAGVDVSAIVPNPIDVDAWGADTAPGLVPRGDHLLWMGRMTPEKGAHRAIEVARRCGRPLVLAGPVQPGQERFFAGQVEPHLDGVRIRHVGEVGGRAKRRLFASAHAFLMPIRWQEPFGMVMVEAMAAGTPVIAFAQGSAPEVVEHGRSGLLVADEREMAAAVEHAGELSASECRASARERFAPDLVAARYERAYRALAPRAAAAAPAR